MSQDARTIDLLKKLQQKSNLSLPLGPGRVAVIVSPAAARSQQGQLLAFFLANLVSRLHPVVKQLDVVFPVDHELGVVVPRWTSSTIATTTARFLQDLCAPAQSRVVTDITDDHDVVVGVGEIAGRECRLYVGACGWNCLLSTVSECPTVGPANPIGAYAAACFAAAEIWKTLLQPVASLLPGIPVAPLAGDFRFSTFTYGTQMGQDDPGLPSAPRLEPLTIVGVGAGGSATAFTLGSISGICGDLCLIDPDEVTDTNLNRLVVAAASDGQNRTKKTELVRTILSSCTGFTVNSLPYALTDVIKGLSPVELRHVVAAVHSRSAREQLQWETPQVVWDAAASETGEFYVYRVELDRTPCLCCRFVHEQMNPEQVKAEQLAMALGLPVASVVAKMRDNQPFTEDEAAAVAAKLQADGQVAHPPSPGQRLAEWEAEQCGKLKLSNPDDEIPIPFAPVMAGVLLAGEVMKQNFFPGSVLASRYWNTLMGKFMLRNRALNPAREPACAVCSQPVLLDQFRRRWRQ